MENLSKSRNKSRSSSEETSSDKTLSDNMQKQNNRYISRKKKKTKSSGKRSVMKEKKGNGQCEMKTYIKELIKHNIIIGTIIKMNHLL